VTMPSVIRVHIEEVESIEFIAVSTTPLIFFFEGPELGLSSASNCGSRSLTGD